MFQGMMAFFIFGPEPNSLHPLESVQRNEPEIAAVKTAGMIGQHQGHAGRNDARHQNWRYGAPLAVHGTDRECGRINRLPRQRGQTLEQGPQAGGAGTRLQIATFQSQLRELTLQTNTHQIVFLWKAGSKAVDAHGQ